MKKSTFIVRFSLILFLIISFWGYSSAQTGATFAQWGEETLNQIESDLGISNSNLYAEDLNGGVAYAWPQGVALEALMANGKIAKAEAHANEMHDRYWCYKNDIWGYSCVADACGDRFYDDNAWLAICLMELYEITNNSTYLERAKDVVAFCMAGELDSGGLKWKEGGENTYNIIATAATTVANLMIYQASNETRYYDNGLRLYNWMKSQEWGFGPGYRAYETAVQCQAAILLYEITGDVSYRDEAQYIGQENYNTYIENVDPEYNILHETGQWGGHDLTNSYVALYEMDRDDKWLSYAKGYLKYLHDNCKDADGRYPEKWDDLSGGDPSLIYQAPVAVAYGTMSAALGPDAFSTIQAENFDYKKGPIVEDCPDDNTDNLGGIQDGYYSAYHNVNFDNSDVAKVEVRVSNGTGETNSIEIRLGSPGGTLLGTVSVPATGSWETYTTETCDLIYTNDLKDVYLVYKSTDGGYVCNINYFKFIAGQTATGLKDGTYTLENRNSGLVMDVEGGGTENGVNIFQWPGHGGESQQWTFTDVGSGVYKIKNVNSGKVVDVKEVSQDNLADIHQWDYVGGDNQKFRLVACENGYYKMEALHSGKIVEVKDGGRDAGDNIVQYEDNNQFGGQWALVDPNQYKSAQKTTKISDINVSKISLYPNPAANKITLTNIPPDSKISIANLYGQTLLRKISAGEIGDVNINIHNLKAGAYIIRIENEESNTNKSFKLLKK